jgi:hypothetical protein
MLAAASLMVGEVEGGPLPLRAPTAQKQSNHDRTFSPILSDKPSGLGYARRGTVTSFAEDFLGDSPQGFAFNLTDAFARQPQ